MAIEKIDLDMCTGCGKCADVCPLDVIRFDEIEKKPYIAYADDCICCTSCESYCPVSCITVMPTRERRIPAPY